MDFNTGGSGSGAPPPPPPSGGVSASGGGSEFSLQDPVGSFIATVRGVLLSPAAFFRGIRKRGDFVSPLVFAAICAVIYSVLTAIISLVTGLAFGSDSTSVIGTFLFTLIGGPILSIIGLFIGAAIYHLFVYLLAGPGRAGYEGTFRVAAYGSALLLISWLTAIPILGILIGLAVLVYTIYIYIMGMREMHGTSTGRAAAIVLLPTAIAIILALIFVAVIIAIVAAAMGGQSGF